MSMPPSPRRRKVRLVRDGVPNGTVLVVRATPADREEAVRSIAVDAGLSGEVYAIELVDGYREVLHGVSVFARRPGVTASEVQHDPSRAVLSGDERRPPPGRGFSCNVDNCQRSSNPAASASDVLGKLRGEVPSQALFRAAPLRTTRASFDARGSPVIYAVWAVGCPLWIASWQGWQTTRVLRRVLNMSAAHAGWPMCVSRLASLRTWRTITGPGSPHSSHLRVKSRRTSSFLG